MDITFVSGTNILGSTPDESTNKKAKEPNWIGSFFYYFTSSNKLLGTPHKGHFQSSGKSANFTLSLLSS